jgi:putative ABC transport system permease protein
MVIRLQAGDIPAAIDYVKTTWQRVIPAYPFDYKFVDQDIDRMYKGWEDMGKLLNYFTILAILIASLGLFGLASFTAEQRTKEIGVRKVLGASVRQVVLLISKEFTKWVLVANLIAWPISYYVMNNWLQGFDYRISMSWWIFISSGLLALFIALLTVSFQSIKAALANPVDALKYE